MRGRVKVAMENRQDNEQAIRYLQQAVAADPNLAVAYAELSRAYSIRAFYFAPDSEKKRLVEDAEIAVERALALSPDLAEAWFARGLMLWTPGRRFPHDQAIAAYRRALSLNPKLDEAHHQLALVLLHVGLFEEARAHIDSALKINPLNSLARFRYGVISLYSGDIPRADAFFRSTSLDRNPSLWGFQNAIVLFRLGRSDSASALVSRFLAENPMDEGGVGHSVLAMIAARAGLRAEADSAIARAVALGRNFGHFHHTAFNIAVAQTMLGRNAQAIESLERAAEDGFPCYPLFVSDVELAPLRSEPRFIALLDRIKLETERYREVLNVR
jgi:tetratricopeptide (TPR) repeat protein